MTLIAGTALAGAVMAASGFDNDLEKTYQVSAGGKFILQADQGSCKIHPVEDGKIQVRVLRHVKGGTQAQADQLFANHEVTFRQEGNTVSVIAKNKKNFSWSWRPNQAYLDVNYEITIPRRFDVDLQTAGGDILVDDLDGQAKARTSSGAINLGKTTGNVEASNSGGNIVVEQTGGDLSARTSSGAIRVQKIGRRAELSDSGGDIQVGEAGSRLIAKTSSGSIKIGTAKGDLEAHDAGGDISAENVEGDVTVETSSGAIRLKKLQGARVYVRNSGGDIQIDEASGHVSAKTSSGSIKIKKVAGALTARNSGGEIHVDEAGGKTELETSSGSIKVTTAKGGVEAVNSGGDINIGEVDGPLSARTSSGSIAVKLAKGNVDAKNSGGDIDVGEAHSSVQAATSSGAIRVNLVRQPIEDCRLEVSGGGIVLSLPKAAAINLDARSVGGKIESEMPVTVQGEHHAGALEGKLNGGGTRVVLRSSSGDIKIKAGTGVAAAEDASANK